MNEPQPVGSLETDTVRNTSLPSSQNNGMNGDVTQKCSKEDLALLARLEQQNKLIESDSKSLNSLASSHSRKSSNTSQVSFNSGNSPQSIAADDEQDDVWMTWGQVVNEWGLYIKKKNSYMKDLVRKGIPHHFRGIAWQLLCNAQTCTAKNNYAEYIKSYSPCEKVIRRDIARTYPEHEFFREKDGVGQESLLNVMKAYSLHDKEVGYCQGSAFIVGLLLLQMPEEEAFVVLVRLMEDYRLREIYKPTMAELGLRIYQLECIVQEILPELHMHLQSQSFHTSMYASSWFLTLFTASLPFQLACRVMDLVLSEGMEVVFRIAVAILQLCKEDLLQLDMEGMLKYFQKEMPSKCETDPDYLINMALQVNYNSRKMKKLEKEYSVLKTKEQQEMIEMRRLRTENRTLRQRIENLEQESSTLANKLIQGQVSRAQEAEDNFVIKRELVALQDKENAIRQELNEAYKQIQELHKIGSQPPSLDIYTDDIVKSLQEELVAVKLRGAEKDDLVEHLRQKIQELEEANKILRETKPDNSIANLQEELIASKLREAEGHLAIKELRQKVSDLYLMWETHLTESKTNCSSPSKKQEKTLLSQLQEDLLSAKLHETDVTAELKELRQKIMELETQNQVSLNQVRRQVEEVEKLQGKLETVVAEKSDLQNQLKEEQRKNVDLHSQMKEEQIMSRIREVEQTQIIAELKQKVSSLEIKNQEIVTADRLSSGAESDDIKDLHDQLADLKAEVMRLETQNRRLISTVALQNLRQNSNGVKTCNYSEESLSHVNSLLELAVGRNNKAGDDVLSDQILHFGRESNHLASKDLFKNSKLNGEL